MNDQFNNYNQNVNQQPVQQPMYQPQYNYQQPNTNDKNNNKSKIIAIVVILVLLVIAVIGFIKFKNDDKPSNNTNKECVVVDKAPLIMQINEVYNVMNEGTYVSGKIGRGTIKVNDEIEIIGLDMESITTTVVKIEKRKVVQTSATEGDDVLILLDNVERNSVKRGQYIIVKGTMKSIKKFDADIHIFTYEEGGRHTPIYSGYAPQIYSGIASSSGKIKFLNGVKEVNPGEKVSVTIELTTSLPFELCDEFKIREGGRTVGEGKITKIY